ncbi:MAG TPA: hypothetical protein VFY48_09840 [Solirubrobacterales bacterium]|nr:hypothetical protein [Solirubrobacterales bacterium]
MAMLALSACLFAGQAQAAPGAYKVLLAEAFPEGAKKLQSQVAAFPGIAAVDLADTEKETPTAAQLAGYDVVVSIGDSSYLDPEAWGNSLASFVDSGGVVVQTTYDTWDGGGAPTGRFESGGYAPFIPGNNDNESTTLGAFDTSSPLMQGVVPGSLTTELNTTNVPTPGTTVVASWADGRPSVAFKGRVVAITAFIGDHYGEVWTGNYGQIVYNAVRTFGQQVLTVTNANPAGGTVTGSGGISCGTTCSANFLHGAAASLTATANPGYAFAGFSGACTGGACNLTMDAAKAVTASFSAFGFGKKVKKNKKKGTAQLTVKVGGPGSVLVSGKKVKKQTKTASQAGKVVVPIVAKGKARKALKNNGKAKVKFSVAYTPTGGSTATLTKSVVLKLNAG